MEENAELIYWRTLAQLRGELVGALMSRNTPLAAKFINEIERLGPSPEESAEAKKRRINIEVALEDIRGALDSLEFNLNL